MLIPQAMVQQGAAVATYTPTLTGSVSDPTLGASSESYGYYQQVGDAVWFWVRVQVGGAGFVNGSGIVNISLPLTADSSFGAILMPVGAGAFFDTSGADSYICTGFMNNSTTVRLRQNSTTTADLTYTSPATWAANDEVYIAGSYVLP